MSSVIPSHSYQMIVVDNNVCVCVYIYMSRGSVLAFSTQVRGFKPGLSRQIFKGEKILSTPSFGGK